MIGYYKGSKAAYSLSMYDIWFLFIILSPYSNISKYLVEPLVSFLTNSNLLLSFDAQYITKLIFEISSILSVSYPVLIFSSSQFLQVCMTR